LKLLGKIIKVHGYGGAVMVHPEEYTPEELKEGEWVFVEIEEKPVPFFIGSLTEHASGNIILKFEHYDSSEQMTEFTGCKVFTGRPEESPADEIPAHEILTGYKVYGGQDEYIGVIEKIMSLPMQYMLVIRTGDDKEQLLPLNEDWIIFLDRDRKIIRMDLPGGILDINE
jgi:16S rRNA processing protein RimM